MNTVYESRINGRYLLIKDVGYRVSGEKDAHFELSVHRLLTPAVFQLFVDDADSTGLLARFAPGNNCMYERQPEQRNGYYSSVENAVYLGRKICERYPFEDSACFAKVQKFVGPIKMDAAHPANRHL